MQMLTVDTADKPKALSKRHDLLPDDNLRKTTAAALSQGRLEPRTFARPEDLAACIGGLTQAQAPMFGVPTDPAATKLLSRRMLSAQPTPGRHRAHEGQHRPPRRRAHPARRRACRCHRPVRAALDPQPRPRPAALRRPPALGRGAAGDPRTEGAGLSPRTPCARRQDPEEVAFAALAGSHPRAGAASTPPGGPDTPNRNILICQMLHDRDCCEAVTRALRRLLKADPARGKGRLPCPCPTSARSRSPGQR